MSTKLPVTELECCQCGASCPTNQADTFDGKQSSILSTVDRSGRDSQLLHHQFGHKNHQALLQLLHKPVGLQAKLDNRH